MGFLIGLGKEWSNLGLKGLPSKPHNPSVSLYHLMSPYNLRTLKMMDGRRLSTQQSPNIVADPTCIFLLLRRLTPFYKMPLTIRQWNPLMLARDWKMRPTMPLTKENPLLPLPHPQMTDKSMSSRIHLRDDCSHVINEIRPKGLEQPNENSERSIGVSNNKGRITSQSGKYGF